MQLTTKIAFIGGGMMGEAIIVGLLKSGAAQASQIVASDPLETRRALLAERHARYRRWSRLRRQDRLGENEKAIEWYQKGMLEAKEKGEQHALGELRGAFEELTF